MTRKRIIVNAALILVLIVIAVFCYNLGKSYKVLLENIRFDYQGVSYPGIEAMQATIDQGKVVYLLEGDRMIGVAIGKNHTLKLEFLDINDQVTETRYLDFNIDDLGGNLAINVARAFQFGSLTPDGAARYEPYVDPSASTDALPSPVGGFTFGRPTAPANPEPAEPGAAPEEPYVEEDDPAFPPESTM